MTPFPLWIGSFVWLAFAAAFVCTAVKEDDDRALLPKVAGMFLLIAGGTGAFCGAILAIETFF